MPAVDSDIERRIQNLADDELIEMIEEKSEDYTEEALQIAMRTVENRGGLNNLKRRIREKEKRELEEQRKADEMQLEEEEIDSAPHKPRIRIGRIVWAIIASIFIVLKLPNMVQIAGGDDSAVTGTLIAAFVVIFLLWFFALRRK